MRFKVILLLLFFGSIGFAQSPSEADNLFNQRKYQEAGKMYDLLLNKRSTDPLYNYRYARCLYEMQDYKGAIKYFLAGGNKYPLRDYYLADSYFYNYQFSEAIEFYNTYLNSTRVNENFVIDILDKLRRARLAARLMNRVEDIAIVDSVVVDQREFLKHYTLSKETGQLQQKSVSMSHQGTIDLISFVTQRGDRKIHSDTIGSKIHLYAANKLLDGWSKSEFLSDNVNMTGNTVNYPFLRLDGLTLFFASNGENSIGGYDIFITRFAANTNDYLKPENIGMPFNSLYNDYMLVIDESNQTGWFASDRYQPEGKVVVYQFQYRDEKNYIPEDDQEYLVKAAQLKTSRKATLKDTEIIVPVKENDNGTAHEIKFILNDEVTYTNTHQFRSSKALQLWNEMQRISNDLVAKEATLSDMREHFESTEHTADRKLLTQEMISLENYIVNTKILLDEKAKNIREEEINYINHSH